jgi:Putative transposase, YhgA-like
MPDYDGLYHRLFSHPRMVAQMLREFVAGPWLDDLDLDGMERLNAKFHAGTSERRDGDMIWRIPRRGGGDTYLVLLLEFQSTPDHWMALRALVYAGLLWQHLVAEKRLPLDGRLPPVLPVVLYNGDRRWAAPLALNELVGLPENSPLWRWQLHMRNQIVDEGAFGDEDLAGRGGKHCRRCCFGWRAFLIPSRLLAWPTRWWHGSCAIRGSRGCGLSLPKCWAA